MACGDVSIPTERLRALERAGQWETALAEHNRIFDEGWRCRDTAALVAALYGQARVLHGRERLADAQEMAELCREVALRAGDAEVAARVLNLLAILRFLAGDDSASESLFLQAIEEGRDVGDDRLIAFASQNLGAIADARGDLEEARRCYLESVGASVRSGDQVSTVMVYNNLGITCGKLEEHLEAERYFERGIEIAERLSLLPLLALLHVSRAAAMIRAGDLERARGSLEQAESLARPIEAVSTLAEVARLRGVLARETDEWQEAEQRFAEALRLAATAKQPLTRAETLEELAELRWRRGRRVEARAMLERALRDYREFHARRRAEQVVARLAEWKREDEPPVSAPAPDVRLSPGVQPV